MFSPYSSPSTAFLLQRRVLSWAKETGSPATVRVRVADRSFILHRVSQSLRPTQLWCGGGAGLVMIMLTFVVVVVVAGSSGVKKQALRRQGMKEKYVSPVVLFYANKWVLSKKTHKFWASTDEAGDGETDANRRATEILQGVVDLLPVEASGAVPVAFYFALLSRSLALELKEESRTRLRDQVASQLQFASADDLPLPEQDADRSVSVADSLEVVTMESIVSNHVAMQRQGAEAVAELWDRYLVQIVADPKLRPERLAELIGVVPAGDRKTHDHLYEAINTYLLEHPGLSGEEKAALCGHLECRKLSHEACIQAVQNERMPLRFIVQALFVQQMHTHRAFAERSDSFRYMLSGELIPGVAGAYTPSPGCPVPTSQPLSTTSPYTDAHTNAALDGKLRARGDDDAASDYETASFRIQALEQEIVSLKKTLQRHNTLKGGSGSGVGTACQRKISLKVLNFLLVELETADATVKPGSHGCSDCSFVHTASNVERLELVVTVRFRCSFSGTSAR
ncbi:unnamed protein product [Triticum turgidum subsp. durum]|uniref:NPH3 domain-containing protein n=1 Tax=Triticum turgidum subsp. durum TaxID=4567 RepID=A0A9R1R525_TRITD|nr:unnamed protein product [Triticum turgidum subsp. durum]